MMQHTICIVLKCCMSLLIWQVIVHATILHCPLFIVHWPDFFVHSFHNNLEQFAPTLEGGKNPVLWGLLVFFGSTESTLSTGWVNIDFMLWLHCGGLICLTTFKYGAEFGKEGTTSFSHIWQLLSVWIMFALYSNFTVLYKKLEARSLPLSPSLSRFLKVLGHSQYISLSLICFPAKWFYSQKWL